MPNPIFSYDYSIIVYSICYRDVGVNPVSWVWGVFGSSTTQLVSINLCVDWHYLIGCPDCTLNGTRLLLNTKCKEIDLVDTASVRFGSSGNKYPDKRKGRIAIDNSIQERRGFWWESNHIQTPLLYPSNVPVWFRQPSPGGQEPLGLVSSWRSIYFILEIPE